MPRVVALLLITAATALPGPLVVPALAADEIFSGPQAGEPLPPLPVEVMFAADDAAKQADLAAADPAAPHRLIVFVHAITRPSVGFTRTLMTYAATRTDDGLRSAVVFLADDQTVLRQQLERARHALPTEVPIAISTDGAEGPGSYGLNRNVTLTILVAKAGTVQANFALVDPSIPVELPKVVQAICDVVGGTPPSLETLMPAMRRGGPIQAAGGAAAMRRDATGGDAKQDDAKQDDTKQDDTKQDDTKRDDTKRDDTKRDDAKRDDAR